MHSCRFKIDTYHRNPRWLTYIYKKYIFYMYHIETYINGLFYLEAEIKQFSGE